MGITYFIIPKPDKHFYSEKIQPEPLNTPDKTKKVAFNLFNLIGIGSVYALITGIKRIPAYSENTPLLLGATGFGALFLHHLYSTAFKLPTTNEKVKQAEYKCGVAENELKWANEELGKAPKGEIPGTGLRGMKFEFEEVPKINTDLEEQNKMLKKEIYDIKENLIKLKNKLDSKTERVKTLAIILDNAGISYPGQSAEESQLAMRQIIANIKSA